VVLKYNSKLKWFTERLEMPVLNHCSIYSKHLASNNSASYLTKALKEATQVVNLITESRLCNQHFKILFYETGVNKTRLLFSSLVVMWQSTNKNAQSQK
jgi:hypothetical protein